MSTKNLKSLSVEKLERRLSELKRKDIHREIQDIEDEIAERMTAEDKKVELREAKAALREAEKKQALIDNLSEEYDWYEFFLNSTYNSKFKLNLPLEMEFNWSPYDARGSLEEDMDIYYGTWYVTGNVASKSGLPKNIKALIDDYLNEVLADVCDDVFKLVPKQDINQLVQDTKRANKLLEKLCKADICEAGDFRRNFVKEVKDLYPILKEDEEL